MAQWINVVELRGRDRHDIGYLILSLLCEL